MARDRNQYIAAPDPNKRKHGPATGHASDRKGWKDVRNAPITFPETSKNISNNTDTEDRHPTGEWVHPVTNQDEQRRATNTGNNDVMGEKETEGV